MKWFGPTWGAPCCEPEEQVATPVGRKCIECGGAIRDMDQGLLIPYTGNTTEKWSIWHLNCFLRNIGALKEKP